jgi:hypothetical protein
MAGEPLCYAIVDNAATKIAWAAGSHAVTLEWIKP